MPYASGGKVSQSYIEGGIGITEHQYREAASAKLNGQRVDVVDGQLMIYSSETRTVYSTNDGSEKKIHDNEPTPEGYTDDPRPGQWHNWVDSTWVRDDTAALSAAKSRKLEELKQAAIGEVAAIRNQYPGFERDTWTDQEREASDWAEAAANGATPPDTPTLSGFAQMRGVTVEDMAARVIEKAGQYRPLATSVGGKRQALRDQVNAIRLDDYSTADDAIAAVDAISW